MEIIKKYDGDRMWSRRYKRYISYAEKAIEEIMQKYEGPFSMSGLRAIAKAEHPHYFESPEETSSSGTNAFYEAFRKLEDRGRIEFVGNYKFTWRGSSNG